MVYRFFTTFTDDDGVMTVTLDHPDRSVNTLSSEVLDEFDVLLVDLEHGKHDVRGVIFASAKPGVFIMGADVFEISMMDRAQMRRFIELGQNVMNRVARLPMATAAAINGTCLGGGYELALACDYRVAADDGAIRIGLPETKLGIIPAWGGSTRLPRLIGVRTALPMMLAGKTVTPRKAQKLGMIDEVVRREALIAASKRMMTTRPLLNPTPWIDRVIDAVPFADRLVCEFIRRKTREQTYGNYPAADQLINVVETGLTRGMLAGFRAERGAVQELAESPACRNLIRLFLLRNDAKKQAKAMFDVEPTLVRQAAVVGGGTMGAGITHALVTAGIPVRLIEIDHDAMSAALRRIDKILTSDVRAKRMSPLAKKHALQRVIPSVGYCGLALADFVVEAVAEKMAVKRAVFARLDELTREDAILATNTSSLSVREIAQATRHPSRVIGLHFFNPVQKMPLVEVVRTAHASDRAMATGVELALRLGKSPIVVNDAPGFLVNRLLIPYLAEAMQMAGEGVSVARVDEVMKRWGMPMGPFELLDTVGIDIGVVILPSIGGRLGSPIAQPRGVERLVEAGMLGRKTNVGFYDYHGRGEPEVNIDAVRLLREANGTIDEAGPRLEERMIERRLILPMVNEAARALADGVVTSVDLVDLATVLGLGLAPFRGGLVRHAQMVGLDNVIEQMHQLAVTCPGGRRFEPSEHMRLLIDLPDLARDAPPVTHGRIFRRTEAETNTELSEDRRPAASSG